MPVSDKDALQTRKELGLAHLNADRIEEGLKVYAMILRDYPEDVESYIVIGDCYLAQGDAQTAAQLYSYALELSPDNNDIQRRLRLAQMELDTSEKGGREPLVTDLRAIAHLLQRLIGQTAHVTEADLNKATKLLEEIKHSQRPALTVAERLSEIEELIPALLELNVRQARAEGRPDLASALDGLLTNVRQQLIATPDGDSQAGTPGKAGQTTMAIGYGQKKRQVLLVTPAHHQTSPRVILALRALSSRGHQVTLVSRAAEFRQEADIVIAFNPHGDAKLMEILATCTGAKIPILLDLDNDFVHMPETHPAYPQYGLGLAENLRAYTAALLLASQITVASQIHAEQLATEGYRARYLPDGWVRHNSLWEKTMRRRHTINLGWMGSPGQVEEVALIRRMVLRVLREFPHAQLVIGGDAQVYQLFDRLPESRRMFLPPVQAEEYPYLLGQVDILMVPLRDTPFNRARSDRRLMEAGARRVPWVASPIPAYTTWEAGGLIAYSAEDWVTHLRQLILDADLRTSLGQAGWRKAEQREMSHIAKLWIEIIEETLQKQTT